MGRTVREMFRPLYFQHYIKNEQWRIYYETKEALKAACPLIQEGPPMQRFL